MKFRHATVAVFALVALRAADVQWPAYGGGPEGIRYSSLKQVNGSNVRELRVAWTYDAMDPAPPGGGAVQGGGGRGLQTSPLVVDGVLYAISPRSRVIALDAATGKKLWTWDSGIPGRAPNRGAAYWANGNDKRIFTAVNNFVYALNAKTGVPIPGFGKDGRIDLHEDLGRDPARQSVALTTPGVVYKDLYIVGGRMSEGLPASPGDIRAYDARSGKLRWAFHTIPHPGEYGYETWPKDAWTYSGAANSWPGLALDVNRGIVYVPTGSAAADFYGANRVGDNLFSSSLVALEAGTGKRIWHFQVVRHDIWDRDLPSPPTLVSVRRDGQVVDAVAQTTKHGVVFLFDRTNGKPLFPIEYRKYPASTVDGEVAAGTQPLPVKPAPFARQLLTEDMLTKRTPEAHAWALEQFRTFRGGGQFIPLSVGAPTIVFPGFDGGAEWGGSAFDPQTGLLYVNANDLPWTGELAEVTPDMSGRDLYLKECASCHRDDLSGDPPQVLSLVGISAQRTEAEITGVIRQGAGRMPGYPNLGPRNLRALVQYLMTGESRAPAVAAEPQFNLKYRFTGYRRFYDPDGYPAVVPPWGTLNAINLNTGEYAWRIPLGEYPELAAAGRKDTGSENYGGPIVTAGGLVFIGATNFDSKFRAFDKATGKLLWETTLPFAGNTTPVSYEVGGRQFIVIAAGGGRNRGPSGATYVAFALPESK